MLFGGLVMVIGASMRQKNSPKDLVIEDLSEKNKKRLLKLQSKLLSTPDFKKLAKAELKAQKKEHKAKNVKHPHLFVLEFKGDMKASQADSLRTQVSALISVADPERDEVLIAIESPGGMVHGYGFAASQLMRIRENNIRLIAAVDKVAASGGYLMASVGHEIIAAPFAVVGSIGVIAQVPNLNRLLRKHDVDYEEITSGKYKRSVSFLGEITPEGRKHFAEKIGDTHELFKNYVKKLRPQLDLDVVATGDHWFGQEAIELKLVDRIQTSDDYILKAMKTHKVIRLSAPVHKSIAQKFTQSAEKIFENLITRSMY